MKRFLMIAGGVIVALLLVGGGYTAAKLLTEPEGETAVSPSSGRVMESIQIADGGAPVNVRTTILPAPELPDEEAAAFGIVLNRQDDNLTIGTGAIELNVEVDVDGNTGQEKRSLIPSTNGPELEVVITRDTILYRDVTDMTEQLPDQSGEVSITQEVRLVTDSTQLEAQMEVQVWGERRGERIVAELIVFGPLAGGAFE